METPLTPQMRAHPPAGLRNRHLLALDAILLPLATLAGFAIRFEGLTWPPGYALVATWFVVLSVPIKMAVALAAGLYRRVWRHASVHEVEQILTASLISGTICFLVGAFLIPGAGLAPLRVPLSLLVLDALLTAAIFALPRMAVRLIATRRRAGRQDNAQRVLVAGAGAAGAMIVRELRGNPELGLDPVGFVDDDRSKHGNRVSNLPVLGSLGDLTAIVDAHKIDEVIIAMPRAPGGVIREVLDAAAAAKVKTRTVPGMFDIISGRVAIRALRKVEIQDLLRREPVTTSLEAVRSIVAGHTVLVTGAGGSIGSELCRQLVDLGPARVVLAGHGENSIFDILNELQASAPEVEFVPVIVDVRDRELLNQAFRQWTPIAVFHAAAHKHVPLMERNVAEAVPNNVLGTRNVAELAAEHGVERLVIISTDKAVHPTNVMGATKRVAEMVVQMAARDHRRNFVSVRFGNVLGSRGSVVPTFLHADRQRGAGDRHASRDAPLFHDHPGGGAAGPAGGVPGAGRGGVRAGHGGADQDRRPGRRPHSPVRQGSRHRYRDPLFGEPPRREALRGAVLQRRECRANPARKSTLCHQRQPPGGHRRAGRRDHRGGPGGAPRSGAAEPAQGTGA